SLRNLYRNYLYARQTGLPLIILTIDPYGLLWQILSSVFASFLKQFRWARLINSTWAWEDDDKAATEWGLGKTFVVVSPAQNIIYTSDKTSIECVLGRRKEFVKGAVYEKLNFYGRNVNTVNGKEWDRHRKLTAPCFNERVSGFVWEEAVRQSRAMLTKWIAAPKGKVAGMVDDTRIVALHILDAAGFGVKHDFFGGARNPAPGHKLSHRDSLMMLLKNLITAVVMADHMKTLEIIEWVLSKRLRDVMLAFKEFRMYMDEAVAEERRLGATKPNLISTMVRTADAEAEGAGGKAAVEFTDTEIKGNMFIFNLAGHDTTANTLAYAFALLACNVEIQGWVREEIDEVLKNDKDPVYEEVFPKLKRVMAVMYETLRLYGPAPRIPRSILRPNTPLLLTSPDPNSTSPTTITIPPNTSLTLKMHAMHTSATNYTDPTTWNPKRWILPSSPPLPTSSSLVTEKFKSATITQGYAAWSYGPRICPGMKMAQVEFVGVL
ncbi:cytochrome P450, partial [Massarina eburnea CBS 473.64]